MLSCFMFENPIKINVFLNSSGIIFAMLDLQQCSLGIFTVLPHDFRGIS